MRETIDMNAFANYRKLVASVDTLCERVVAAHGSHMACIRGCDGCCRHITVSLVEAYALAEAFSALPEPLSSEVRHRAASTPPDAPCPLLRDGTCLLYPSRPIICRTHGFPILMETPEGMRVDHCPLNFRGVESLPGSAVIQLERLNETLAAVNAVFVRGLGARPPADDGRLSIARAILLDPLRND